VANSYRRCTRHGQRPRLGSHTMRTLGLTSNDNDHEQPLSPSRASSLASSSDQASAYSDHHLDSAAPYASALRQPDQPCPAPAPALAPAPAPADRSPSPHGLHKRHSKTFRPPDPAIPMASQDSASASTPSHP
ncbi:hypothetical protein PTTG_26474, partial [Puccinia triticina 1-1 BBBD Race 1]